MSSQEEIQESLEALLKKGWKVDPVIQSVTLGKIKDIKDTPLRVNSVVFHIPYIESESSYILWKCHWPDCTNCCERQGRLPLTSDDLITIGSGLKYKNTSEFITSETITSTWSTMPSNEPSTTISSINLKRSSTETIDDDGTRIPCRFLDVDGACTLHPGRPGVCYLYPFMTWLENEAGVARVHATFQFTGDCPGFYLSDSTTEMNDIFKEYSGIITDYNMSFARTVRESFAGSSMS